MPGEEVQVVGSRSNFEPQALDSNAQILVSKDVQANGVPSSGGRNPDQCRRAKGREQADAVDEPLGPNAEVRLDGAPGGHPTFASFRARSDPPDTGTLVAHGPLD